MTFDRNQVEAFYADIKNSEAFPQAFCEELFLIGKFTEDTALQQEIGEILAKNFDATVGKAYKKRKKFPNKTKYNAHTVMETLFVYGEISPTLDLDKMYQMAGFVSGHFHVSDKWDAIPEGLARLTSLTEFSVPSYAKINVLPEFLETLVHLEEVELERLTAFPAFITRLPALKKLEVKLGYMSAMPDEVFEIETLEELDLKGTAYYDNINPAITFTKSLRKLKNLKKLDLYYFAQDSLPDDFFEGLDNLEHLRIGRFPNLKYLPASIGKLKNLQKLEIHVMGALQELPASVSELTNLQEIKLGTITDLQIPVEILALPALENIGFHNMTNMQIQTNSAMVSNLKRFRLDEPNIWNFFWENVHLFAHLEELSMSATQSLSEVPDKISELKNLRKLMIGGDFVRISEKIGELQNLEMLSIGNALNLESLPTSLAKLVHLKELKIENFAAKELIKLVGKASCLPASPTLKVAIDCREFVVDLQKANPLQDLTVGSSKITKPENLHFLDKIKRLKLTRANSLPAEIGNLKTLETLYLSGEFDKIPDSVGKLQNLQKVTLWCKDSFKGLPDSFGQLANLRTLFVSKYSGTNLEAIFDGLTNLQELEIDKFSEMEALPACLARLPKLEVLKIDSCEKLYHTKDVLRQMKNLKKLRFRFVNSEPDKMDAIVMLENLEFLELCYCKNISSLPPAITNLQKLQVLHLNNLHRIREIPAHVGELKSLHTLVLEGLRLPTLPTSLVDLPHLEQMSISTTWFDAPLPEELRALRLKKLGNWQSKFSGHNQKKAVYEVLLSAGTQMVKSLT
ncbi:MAG: hypothetical protein EAZ95_10330 [Bacteroidetes bacterium]|nr:MAG: hypothetical protein EAZ95_10330 [Bacteroidota bacterium]